jgi:phi LC3 family holin
MKLNLKVRAKNKVFWVTLIPAVLLLVQLVLALFGITFNLEQLQGQIIAIVDVVFVILSTLGIVVDPTTKGLADTDRAMTFEEPYSDDEEV